MFTATLDLFGATKTFSFKKDYYAFGRQWKIQMYSTNGCPYMTVTTYVEECMDAPLADFDLVLIKDYSENHGILEALVKAKIVSEPLEGDYGDVALCRLLAEI